MAVHVDEKLILRAIAIVRRNWADWRDAFEHVGPVATNPVVEDSARFGEFVREYSVQRTIRKRNARRTSGKASQRNRTRASR